MAEDTKRNTFLGKNSYFKYYLSLNYWILDVKYWIKFNIEAVIVTSVYDIFDAYGEINDGIL